MEHLFSRLGPRAGTAAATPARGDLSFDFSPVYKCDFLLFLPLFAARLVPISRSRIRGGKHVLLRSLAPLMFGENGQLNEAAGSLFDWTRSRRRISWKSLARNISVGLFKRCFSVDFDLSFRLGIIFPNYA